MLTIGTVYCCKIHSIYFYILIDFSLTVKAATLIFISGRGSAISSAKEWKSGFIGREVKPRLIFSFYLCLRMTSPNYAFMRHRLYSMRKVIEYSNNANE